MAGKKKTPEEIKALWAAETKAGETRLSYQEWAARFIMEEARLDATAAVDKTKPVNKSSKSKPDQEAKPLEGNGKGARGSKDAASKQDKPPEEAQEKPVPLSGSAVKEKPDQPAPAGPLLDDKGISVLPVMVVPEEVLTSGLTKKQEMFCREYLVDYNATQAAIRAGYSEKTARVIGPENLSKPAIQAFLQSLQKPKLEALDISQERILKEYEAMAFTSLGHFLSRKEDGSIHTVDGMPTLDFDGVTDHQLAGLAGFETIILPAYGDDEPNPIKIKIKLADKKGALDVLAKRAGLLKDHIEHSGEVKIKGDAADLARRIAFMLRKASVGDKKEQ